MSRKEGLRMQLSEADLGQARRILLQSDLDQLARLMTRLQFRSAPAATRTAAEELGWLQPGSDTLTEKGWFGADVCREFVFWLDRDRRLPFGELAPTLETGALAGKSVLEIGSGSGMNLMSLARICPNVVGLEPVGIYRQLGTILAEVEGLGQIRTEAGQAEALPFDDNSFDVVLCVSSHQYFDLRPALDEIARVLRPGGEAILISGTLGSYALGGMRKLAVIRSVKSARSYAVTLVNTLGYRVFGKRVLVRRSKWSTAYPVYPSQRSMARLLAGAGLPLHHAPLRIGTETCFRGRKA
jgi:SAM-dependent methyltransferase